VDDGDVTVEELVEGLDEAMVRRLLAFAAGRDEETARAVRRAAAGPADRLEVLRGEVDDGLRTRRHLGYWESSAWAAEARPVVDALAEAVADGSSRELIELLQRAVGHVIKVILRADDSDGMIGDLARQLLDLHVTACDAGAPDPARLAKWMVKFCFVEQDFFELDPVRYANALGAQGIATYRREVEKRSSGSDVFAARYARERLAILDRDVDELVRLLGGDLSAPHQYLRVAEAMVELGLEDEAIRWARTGIDTTSGWQVGKLYDVIADLLDQAGDAAGVVEVRQEHHDRMPSATTYTALKNAASATGEWSERLATARRVLGERDRGGLIDVLLADGEPDAAWEIANEPGEWEPGERRWKELAEAREPTHPADSLAVHLRLVDDALTTANRRAYRVAIRYLKGAERAATAAGATAEFDMRVAELREIHRRRPSLITMLDKAGFR
jgi:hypothetical protein